MYSTIPILIAVLALIVVGIVIVVLIFKNSKGTEAPRYVFYRRPVLGEGDRTRIRQAYLNQLSDLENKLRAGDITYRPAYQELSRIIRNFAKAISGVDVTTSTLSEMKAKKIPVLTELIETYYEPEFAVETDDDVFKAISGARTVMERWN